MMTDFGSTASDMCIVPSLTRANMAAITSSGWLLSS